MPARRSSPPAAFATAIARWPGKGPATPAVRCRAVLRSFLILALGGLGAPATAQVTIEATVQSDLRHRGYSLSGEQPVAIASLGYDHPSGAYLGASAIGVARDGEPDFLGAVGNLGYAMRIAPDVSLDIGALRAEYSPARRYAPDYDYSEAYVGASWRNLAARAHFSPDYYSSDRSTLYLELEAAFEPAPSWQLSAHVGSLTYLEAPPPYLPRREYDWRVGAARQVAGFSLFAEVSGRLEGRAYAIRGTNYEKTAVVFGVSRAF